VDRAFVLLSALPITAGIVLVAGMLLAAIAFTSATSIQIPFVVTFGGFEDESGAHAVSVAESWAAAAALTFILAGPLAAVALRCGHHHHRTRSLVRCLQVLSVERGKP